MRANTAAAAAKLLVSLFHLILYSLGRGAAVNHHTSWLQSTGLFAMQAQQEVDEVLGDRQQPNMQDYAKLKYVMRCVNESMRLYPHPPVLLRRAMVQDELPGTVHALALQPTICQIYTHTYMCMYQYQSIVVSPGLYGGKQELPKTVTTSLITGIGFNDDLDAVAFISLSSLGKQFICRKPEIYGLFICYVP